ncbi:hypothetical protein Rleg4DRAFT_4324 [Rhizobium leguminosarum bv. trifolii WSM2297]|uniref:Uncharacterized protein n=1 Tax=Rhizobium leguminosarum bv. trifolii WSM2297 TaxID=754762 RepID=J0KXT2_RHILT|nr:DUF6428 family protein [Rhizobium leguminosarum]EJC82609.1 hypothetical protein Rleg4DRAFT_4324 [Rhizobium leguminosarum bv. trifolii WSM2297]
MNVIDNGKMQKDDICLGDLMGMLAAAENSSLIFYYDGRPVKPGYHVTEVKAGQFSALDCGANPESWTEIFIQLWDIEDGDRSHMPAGKFHAIVRKVTEHAKLGESAKLTFEVSDGVQPMRLYCAALPTLRADSIHVELSPRPASCKPRDRWLAEQQIQACCGPSTGKSACCA